MNRSDTLMIIDLAKELGISPLDLFLHWIKNDEIKNIAISVIFNDNDELKIELSNDVLEKIIRQNSEKLVGTSVPIGKNLDNISLPEVLSDNTHEGGGNISDYEKTTSFSKGIIHIKNEQKNNVSIGAYVYTTGDILSKPNAVANVNMRGIIMDLSETTITLIKYVGMGYTAVEACSKEGKGWRFLSMNECLLLRSRREKLNDSFLRIHRKQIDDSALVLCKNDDELAVFDIKKQQMINGLLSDGIMVDRTFYLYMAKTLRIV